MCTVITLQRPGHPWPLLLAANRDEQLDRPWQPPAEHWPDHPGVVGGLDVLAGGTWMAVNPAGVAAAVLNRPGSLGPAPGKRSRGALPVLALTHDTAEAAAHAIARLDGAAYRSFNFLAADRHAVWFVRNDEAGRIEAKRLSPGLHMVTAHDPDDLTSPRVARHQPRFQAAPAPEPPDWASWPTLLADEAGPPGAALSVAPDHGFGTASASLLGMSAAGAVTWLFAPGRAGAAAFAPVTLPSAPRVASGPPGCYTPAITRG